MSNYFRYCKFLPTCHCEPEAKQSRTSLFSWIASPAARNDRKHKFAFRTVISVIRSAISISGIFILILLILQPTFLQAASLENRFSSEVTSASKVTSNNAPQNIKPIEEGYIDIEKGKLYYQSYGHGPLIILLHGGPGLDQSYLVPQMLELAKNHQLVLYDQRGSGKSLSLDIFSNQRINVAQFVQDLEALRIHLGKSEFILMGHSWGGLLAMQYAIAYPKQVTSLVLINSFPATNAGLQAYVTEYNRKILPIKSKLDELLTSKPFLSGDPNSLMEFYRTLYSIYFYDQKRVRELSLHPSIPLSFSNFKISKTFMNGYFTKNLDLRPELKKLKIPTLIIGGDADIIPTWTAKEIAEAIPKSKLLVLKQCGHFPYIEQPEAFFTGVKSLFLTR